jgi:hypothetical protein
MISLFCFLAAATMWFQTLTGLKSGFVRSKYGFGSEQDDTGLMKVLLGKKVRKEQSPVAFWVMFAMYTALGVMFSYVGVSFFYA